MMDHLVWYCTMVLEAGLRCCVSFPSRLLVHYFPSLAISPLMIWQAQQACFLRGGGGSWHTRCRVACETQCGRPSSGPRVFMLTHSEFRCQGALTGYCVTTRLFISYETFLVILI